MKITTDTIAAQTAAERAVNDQVEVDYRGVLLRPVPGQAMLVGTFADRPGLRIAFTFGRLGQGRVAVLDDANPVRRPGCIAEPRVVFQANQLKGLELYDALDVAVTVITRS